MNRQKPDLVILALLQPAYVALAHQRNAALVVSQHGDPRAVTVFHPARSENFLAAGEGCDFSKLRSQLGFADDPSLSR
jgi:hypothetical protein